MRVQTELLETEVLWAPTGQVGVVKGLTSEPSAIVEFPDGRRLTIGISRLLAVGS